MGSLSTMSSQKIVVAPEINWVYMLFMIFPVVVAFILMMFFFCKEEKGKDVPTNSYHMLTWGKENSTNPNIHTRTGRNFPYNINNRLVFTRQENKEDGAMEGTLMIRKDPYRPISDPFLHFLLDMKMKTMSMEDKGKWIKGRVDNLEGSADNEYHLYDYVEENESKLDAALRQRVDDRLEYLNATERLQWLREVVKDVDDLYGFEKNIEESNQQAVAHYQGLKKRQHHPSMPEQAV
jgi:hypothetical protein